MVKSLRLCSCSLNSFNRPDIDALVAVTDIKINHTVYYCKECIIFAPANILARVDARPALADEDISRKDEFACVFFGAQALGVAVTPVARRAATFFMRHG